jgi:hypothetical protein
MALNGEKNVTLDLMYIDDDKSMKLLTRILTDIVVHHSQAGSQRCLVEIAKLINYVISSAAYLEYTSMYVEQKLLLSILHNNT